MTSLIPDLTSRGIIFSMGHSEATYEEASAAVEAGASMITHLFNAMRPLHHRNPGIFGVLGIKEKGRRPYFGVIADGIHLHQSVVKIAYQTHPEGFVLVTDAMHLVGCRDGTHVSSAGGNVVKEGPKLTLEGTDIIAGRYVPFALVKTTLRWFSSVVDTIVASIPLITSPMSHQLHIILLLLHSLTNLPLSC